MTDKTGVYNLCQDAIENGRRTVLQAFFKTGINAY